MNFGFFSPHLHKACPFTVSTPAVFSITTWPALVKAEHPRHVAVFFGAVPDFRLVDFFEKSSQRILGSSTRTPISTWLFCRGMPFSRTIGKKTAAASAHSPKQYALLTVRFHFFGNARCGMAFHPHPLRSVSVRMDDMLFQNAPFFRMVQSWRLYPDASAGPETCADHIPGIFLQFVIGHKTLAGPSKDCRMPSACSI